MALGGQAEAEGLEVGDVILAIEAGSSVQKIEQDVKGHQIAQLLQQTREAGISTVTFHVIERETAEEHFGRPKGVDVDDKEIEEQLVKLYQVCACRLQCRHVNGAQQKHMILSLSL